MSQLQRQKLSVRSDVAGVGARRCFLRRSRDLGRSGRRIGRGAELPGGAGGGRRGGGMGLRPEPAAQPPGGARDSPLAHWAQAKTPMPAIGAPARAVKTAPPER